MQSSQLANAKAFMIGHQSTVNHKEQFWVSPQDIDTVVSGCRQSRLTVRCYCAQSNLKTKSSQFSSSFFYNSNTMKTIRIKTVHL